MKKCSLILVITAFVSFQCAIVLADQLSTAVDQYTRKTQTLLESATNDAAKIYLQECLKAIAPMRDLEITDPRLGTARSTLLKLRSAAEDELPVAVIDDYAIKSEKMAFDEHLQPYLKETLISLVTLQNRLLDRKYFKTETAKNANFIEGYANSCFALTRADITASPDDPSLGISPWEAIFRLEPAIAFNGGAQAAIMGTAGLSYACFPSIDRSISPPVFHETVSSKWLRKSGGRIGAGAAQIDDKTRFLLGAGVQVNAIALWGLYEPEDQKWMLGVGMSDLSKLKKIVSWFE